MVSFRRMNKLIRSTGRMTKLMQSRKTRDDSETMKIYAAMVDDLRRMQDELKPMIEALEDHEQRMILTLRYLKGYDYPWIADNMKICERLVYRYLRRAKDILFKLYPGQVEP